MDFELSSLTSSFVKLHFDCDVWSVAGRERLNEGVLENQFAIYETGLASTDNKLAKEHGIHQYWLAVDRNFLRGTVDISSHAASPVPADRLPVKIKSGIIRRRMGDSL
jgi:hypothetical protein